MNASLLGLVLAVLAGPTVETAKEPRTHLYVRTIPPGAKIILDERPGTTDGLLTVTPGKHRIVVELDGYAPERREVDVPQGRITRVEVTLKPTNDSYDGRSMAEWKRLALNDVSAATRAKAMDALEAFGNRGRAEEAVAAIKGALAQEKDTAVIEAAYHALYKLGPFAVPVLLDRLGSRDPGIRRVVIKASETWVRSEDKERNFVPEQVVGAVIAATRDPDPTVRGEACYALGFRVFRGRNDEHSDKIIAALIKALDDEAETTGGRSSQKTPTVQSMACDALGGFHEKAAAAIPALLRIVHRTPTEFRRKGSLLTGVHQSAVMALGSIGPAAKDALPTLRAMQEGPIYGRDRQLELAIRQIQTYREPFAPPAPPKVAVVDQPKPPPKPRPPFDVSKHAVLMGIVSVDGQPMALFKDRIADKEYRLRPGEQLAVGTFEGTVGRIGERDVEFLMTGSSDSIRVRLGESLTATDESANAAASKAPGRAVAAAKHRAAKGAAAGATGPKAQASAQPAAKAASVSAAPLAGQDQADKVEDLVEKALLETDAGFDFDATPLTDVVEILRNTMKINILLDGNALDESSIDPSTTQVTIRMRASRGSAIDFMLSQLGLTWTVRDGAMVITTAGKAQEELSTKVYPIEDLAVRGDHNSLIDIITTTIAPQTWDKAGGPGSIMVVGVPRSARLVIRQTYQVHRQIRQLLATVRTMDADAEAGKTPEPVLLYAALTASPAALQYYRKALAQPVSGFDFDQLPLTDVVDILRNVHKATIVLDHVALENKNIDPSTTSVNFRVQGIPLGQALALLLEQLGLSWTLEGDYVRITTKEFAEGRLVVGVYPVGDLAKSREGRYGGSTVRDNSGLIATITGTIAPKTWVAGRGSIRPVDFGKFNGLVILQTDAVHRQIVALLAQLRAKGEPPASKPAPQKAETSKF